jgi:hypothetical protein
LQDKLDHVASQLLLTQEDVLTADDMVEQARKQLNKAGLTLTMPKVHSRELVDTIKLAARFEASEKKLELMAVQVRWEFLNRVFPLEVCYKIRNVAVAGSEALPFVL